MTASQTSEVMQFLRNAVLRREGSELADGELLECFVCRGELAALEVLVRRHGPMVWGVCLRILRDPHDAEDAFQASFLVLVRKAASIVPREMVGNWLYGVARRTALKAKATRGKRRAREKQVAVMPEPAAAEQDCWHGLQPLLDRELSRLPDKYRAVIVLCDLESRCRREVARQLGLPEGTVASRLARARALLASRLSRRGVVLASGLLASVCVPEAVEASTIEAATLVAAGQAAGAGAISAAAAALTKGVLNAMFLAKIKLAAALLAAVSVFAIGVGFFAHQAAAEKPAAPPVKAEGGKQTKEVHGFVKAVDLAKPAITIQDKALGERTYEVSRDAKVFLDDGTGKRTGFHEGKLADLTEGASASIKLSSTNKAVFLYVEGPSVQGVLKAADARANTITVTLIAGKDKQPADRTFAVAEDAGISIEVSDKKSKGKIDKLSDLTPGSSVILKLSADQKGVGSIRAQGQTISGVFRSADPDKSTITVGVQDGKQTVDRTFAVARDARVALDTGKSGKFPLKQGKLADLAKGAAVTLRLSLDQKAVESIQAEGSAFHGVLKGIDASKHTITVTVGTKGEEPTDRTVDVDRDAQVTIDGKERKLADLPAEARVTVKLTVDQKTAVSIQAEGASVAGAVKGNAANDSITLGGKGDDHTYSVAKDARVLIEDSKEGKLADLIDGTIVSAKLSADGKEIIGIIRAEGPSVHGIVKGVDAKNSTITLTVGGKGGVGGEDRTFTMKKDVSVQTGKFGVPLKLADLRAEKSVILRLSLDQKTAARITVLEE